MRLIALYASIFLLFTSQPAKASSCGWAPTNNITIVDGATTQREEISKNIAKVNEFAEAMTAYLDCLEAERDTIFLNMNKKQQERWNEDYDNNVENLANLQNSLNEQIRAFNQRNDND